MHVRMHIRTRTYALSCGLVATVPVSWAGDKLRLSYCGDGISTIAGRGSVSVCCSHVHFKRDLAEDLMRYSGNCFREQRHFVRPNTKRSPKKVLKIELLFVVVLGSCVA